MAQFLDLLEKVLEGSILPFLSWNDLLRCRRVCKAMKGVTDDYIRLNSQLAPEIEVTEQSEKTLKAFLDMGIPTTKLFINNPTGHHFYDNLDTTTLTNFATTYGSLIKSLRVVEFSVYLCFNERTFFEALTNLKTLEAGHYGYGEVYSFELLDKAEADYHSRALGDPRFKEDFHPDNLTNVESLKIGCNKEYWIHNVNSRLYPILLDYLWLDYLSFPFGSDIVEGILPEHPLRDPFSDILDLITYSTLAKSQLEEVSTLKYVDFINYHEARGMQIELLDDIKIQPIFNFLNFTKVCNQFGMKLLNVNPAWYGLLDNFPTMNDPICGVPVVSLVNLHACVLTLEMPNLEKINICQTSRSTVAPVWNERRPDWPALKTLEINVNSKKAVETETPTQDTALLFKFLWKDIVRDNLTELSLKFEDEKVFDGVAIPKTEDIVNGCPNLRKLRIEKWPGTNKQLTKLWSGLPALEDVALENCKDLGNVAFVGEDVNNPIFLQLKNLKKLTLKGLDQMPKITDTLFSLVLAKMNLTHFIINSDKPLEKITKIGITALLEGRFAETIEKFLFQGWSMRTMSDEDYQEIGKQFRSSNML